MKKGFTLIETLLAITVIGLIITAAMELTMSSLRVGRVSLQEFAAHHLAEEGLEIVRNIRDSNWLRNRPWNENLAAGVYAVSRAEGSGAEPWKIFEIGDIGASPHIAQGSGQKFQRAVAISYDEAGATITIESHVRFSMRGKERNIKISAQLTNWKKGPL